VAVEKGTKAVISVNFSVDGRRTFNNFLAWLESFVEQLLQGLLPAEHPDVYHLPMVKEHRLGDIIANSVTHGIGAALALAGAVVLVVTTVGGTAWQIASCLVFGCTLGAA
jgi:hypothetical protein